MTFKPMAYRIAALSLGIVVAGYWWRVLRMARKARRHSPRGANFMPTEPLGRVLRIVWIPVVMVWVAQPFAVAWVRTPVATLRPLWASPWVAWPMVVIAAACLRASQLCWKTMGKSWRMGIDPAEQNPLILAGPYAYVRHPIYALSQTMMLSSIIAVPTPLMIAAGAMHVLLLQWEARREEAHLTRVHGSRYAEYCGRVNRFLPVRLR